jgi:hypothetical protein
MAVRSQTQTTPKSRPYDADVETGPKAVAYDGSAVKNP